MMKKYLGMISLISILFLLSGCMQMVNRVSFVIPAGTESQLIYSDVEVSPKIDHIEITPEENFGDTSVSLKQVGTETESGGEYLSGGMGVKLGAEKGTWYRIGIIGHNPTDEDITVSVVIAKAEVRVP